MSSDKAWALLQYPLLAGEKSEITTGLPLFRKSFSVTVTIRSILADVSSRVNANIFVILLTTLLPVAKMGESLCPR